MFIGIPLILIGISLIGIIIVGLRKLPYLQKLTPESHVLSQSIWEDYFPEVLAFFRRIDVAKMRATALGEVEKILRKLRLSVVAVERISDRLIHSIRQVQRESAVRRQEKEQEAARIFQEVPEPVREVTLPQEPSTPMDLGVSNVHKKEAVAPHVDVEALKRKEQDLIVAIAQNHKDFQLYGKLGDIYTQLESWNDARESYQTALKLKPDNQELAQKLSLVFQKLLEK